MRDHNKRKNKSYFNDILRRFMIVLLVPLITILLVFAATKVTVEEQIEISSRNTLHQFFRCVDEVFLEAKNLALSTIASDDFQSYSRLIINKGEKNSYYVWKVNQALAKNMNEKYYDMICYYPEREYVVSGVNAAKKWDAYYKSFYQSQQIGKEEHFKEILECNIKRPTVYSLQGENGKVYQCIAMRYSTGNKKYDFVVILVLNPVYIENLLEGIESGDQQGTLFMFDKDGRTIFSVEDNVPIDARELVLNDEILEKNTIQKKDCHIQIEKSENMNFYYAYMVPNSYFLSKMMPIYMIFAVGMIASVIVGVWVIKGQARRTYRPIEYTVANLQQDSEVYNAESKTEFEFIETLFKKEKEEKKNLRRSMRSAGEAKRDKFIFSLLKGDEVDNQKLPELLKEYGIEQHSDLFCVACIRVEQKMDSVYSFVVCNVFEELLDREKLGYIVADTYNEYSILANLKQDQGKEDFYNIIQSGKSFLEKFWKFEISFGISDVQEGVEEICVAYDEAQTALEYTYLLGKNRIIDYMDIADRGFHYTLPSESKMIQMVSEYLAASGAEADVDKLVEKLMLDYGVNEGSSMDMANCYKYEVLNMLNRVSIREKCRLENWDYRLKQLANGDTLEQFNVHLKDILTQLYDKKQEQVEGADICAKAMEYIEEHYRNEQLSRTLIGEELGISYPYLSKLFKEKYRVTITDYITQVRMRHVKEDLKNTDYSIQKIAENNGFSNSQTCIRIFKKLEGVTPGIYREYIKNNQES